MEEQARQRGCTVILLTHGDRLAEQLEHLATLRRYRADGVILTCAPGTTTRIIRSVIPEVPVVAFDSYISSSIDSVLLDNREVARTATEHLLGHGYRNVVCVFGKPETYSFQERAAGYSEVMSAQSLIPRLLTAPSYELLGSVLQEVLQGKDRPEALLSLSDFASRSILTVYRDLGLKMAERIPVLGLRRW